MRRSPQDRNQLHPLARLISCHSPHRSTSASTVRPVRRAPSSLSSAVHRTVIPLVPLMAALEAAMMGRRRGDQTMRESLTTTPGIRERPRPTPDIRPTVIFSVPRTELCHFSAFRANSGVHRCCNMRKMPRTAMAAISGEPAKISGAPGLPLRSRASPAAGVNSVIPT